MALFWFPPDPELGLHTGLCSLLPPPGRGMGSPSPSLALFGKLALMV